LLQIDGSGRLPNSPIRNIYGFFNLECKKVNVDFPFCKITELHCLEKERVVWVLCVYWGFEKLVGIFLSLHYIMGVEEEKRRGAGRNCLK